MQGIPELLRSAKTIAVVDLSSNRKRPSYSVSEYMQRAGYRIVPVNRGETQVLGERAYASLEAVPERIDIVDVFRRSEFVAEIVESAIRVGTRPVWMQEGVSDASGGRPERARRA